jgi:DNA-binding transcriptional LysR family regulator
MASDNVNTIDIRRMRTVVEVARSEAITTAAQTLGLTQSAVSRTVAELEEALGQRLFDRLPRGIQLTEAGVLFVARAKQILVDVDDLVSDVNQCSSQVSGRLRVGVSAVGFHATPALQKFVTNYPSVALETIHASDQTLCPQLMRGELDLVLGSTNHLNRWRDLEVKAVTPLYFACALRKGHPFSLLKQPIEQELLGYPMVVPEIVETSYSDIALRYLFHGLQVLKPQYVTNNLELILHIVKNTDAFFPCFHYDETFKDFGANFHLVRDIVQIPRHELGFAVTKHRPISRIADKLVKVLADEMGSAGFPTD